MTHHAAAPPLPRAALRRRRLLRVGAGRLFFLRQRGRSDRLLPAVPADGRRPPDAARWGVGAIPAALFAFSEPSAIRMIRRILRICCQKRPNDAPRRGGWRRCPRRRSARSFCSSACSTRSAHAQPAPCDAKRSVGSSGSARG